MVFRGGWSDPKVGPKWGSLQGPAIYAPQMKLILPYVQSRYEQYVEPPLGPTVESDPESLNIIHIEPKVSG